MEYETLVEKNINYMMDKMFGDKDIALKTVTKMNLLFDGKEETKKEIEKTLIKMKQMNECESNFICNELYLTYDKDGNIVYVDDIGNEYKNEICIESKIQSNANLKSN